ncbi:MAG: biliverdin-producing heme oxygenase [Acidobacteria bacterium]|nr:biliverdin-producing heme oxygenase [Acidobacteriota bacterium]MBW4044745.1 biliverdin-producing heme oxygenase [Acidobacteriota bacterium]
MQPTHRIVTDSYLLWKIIDSWVKCSIWARLGSLVGEYLLIVQTLKLHTAELHSRIEQRLPLMDAALTLNSYRETLAAYCGFYATWEFAAANILHPVLAAAVRERSKLPLLEADLAELNYSEVVEPLPSFLLPDFRQDAQLIGSMYVLEGSTLGGQLIARHLERKLGLKNGVGYSFFRCYGSQTSERWTAFKALAEHLTPPDSIDAAILAARQTFVAIEEWVCRDVATVASQ